MKNKYQKKYRILAWGGLGDGLMLTPTLKALKLREPNCRIIVYSKSKLFDQVLLLNPYIDKLRGIGLFRNLASSFHYHFFRHNFHVLAYGRTRPSLFYRNAHAIEVIGKMMGVEIIDKQVQIHITERENDKAVLFLKQYKNPLLIQITSRCSNNQNWPVEKWEELIRRMPECTFLQVGDAHEVKVKGAVDLLGKTTIRESMALLKNVKSFVAVVSFLNHASNAFLSKGVVLFGASPPQNWGYPNNINIYKNTVCSPCIDLLGGDPCPYESECMHKIAVEEVQNALEIQLNSTREKALLS